MGGEAIFNQQEIFEANKDSLAELKNACLKTKNKSIRICLHSSPEAKLHEMLIVLHSQTYVRPHKHVDKTESFHIMEGELNVFIFDDVGKITRKIEMGSYHSSKSFYYRLASPHFHTVLPASEFVVFHEVTNGPFIRSETLFADWSPEGHQTSSVERYKQYLNDY